MFFFRYKGPKVFTLIENCKYYSRRWFMEQSPDGTYQRGVDFFVRNRQRLLQEDIALTAINPTMKVKYIGKKVKLPAVRINGKYFPFNQWIEVPIDFDSFQNGQCQFMIHGFQFKSASVTASDLNDIDDGDSILVLRRYGGLGDILMQSMIFPELRKIFPKSKITYAIPKNFMPLFEGCTDINEIIDSAEIDSTLPRLAVSGKYKFIGDISSTCAAYEVNSLRKYGFVDKERSDIWAEGMGLKLNRHETCIRFRRDELADAYYQFCDNRKMIGFAPFSANIDRSYPYNQKLIDLLTDEGYRVIIIHSHKLNYKNCGMLVNVPLRKLGALIRQMDMVISTDTGPLHFAGLFRVPVIGIFGVTDSKVRLSYYNAVAVQGKCDKQLYPCWGAISSSCKTKDNIASCMYIEPEKIVTKAKEIFDIEAQNIRTYKDEYTHLCLTK